MRLLIAFALVGAAALPLIACNSADKIASGSSSGTQVTPSSPASGATPAATASKPADGVRRITTVELQDLIKKGQALVVDVRTQAAYDAGHIKGARLIPNTQISGRAKELPRDKTIVTYCSWPAEQTSAGAVLDLKKQGFENAVALLGGMEAWKKAGLPVDKGQ